MVTLAFLAIASILLVAFVTMTRLDRAATFGYSQSLKTEQLARGALQLVAAQLQLEMAKDAPPDTGGGAYPASPVYTNVVSVNWGPQLSGTNAAMPLLVKASSTNFPFLGTSLTGSVTATALSSASASANGRSVSLSRWNQAWLGAFPSVESAPGWIVVTRAGATNAAGIPFGAAGATLNNPAATNANYAIGRFAYAVYDVGGLLDITAAGHPSSLGADQLQQIRGTLAGADLSILGIDADALVAWRNPFSAATAAGYVDYAARFQGTNGFRAVAPNDTTFLSRQDLIDAAKAHVAGLTTASLTNLTVFSREQDAPNWAPFQDAGAMGGNNAAGSRYAYAANALAVMAGAVTNVNRAAAAVRLPGAASTAYAVPSYRDDGTSFSDDARGGEPLLRRRFPLGRLAWITPTGPLAGISSAAIQACFGLAWDGSRGVWKYVGPAGSAELGAISTLDQVAAEPAKREPNFFELIQAGVLSGSLGTDGGATAMNFSNLYQTKTMLQILRIGAAAIDQASPSSLPTVIEYNQNGGAWQAVGSKNLPYVFMVQSTQGESPDHPGASSDPAAACYLLFTFWNPTQGAPSASRPRVRLRIQGGVAMQSKTGSVTHGYGTPVPNYGPGYTVSFNTTLELSTAAGAGVNGFGGTGALLPTTADVAASLPAAGSGNADGPPTWVRLPTQITAYAGGGALVGLRLPDLYLDPDNTAALVDRAYSITTQYGAPSTDPFTVSMEFWNGTSWIPYQFLQGVNDPVTWIQGPTAIAAASVGLKNAAVPKVAMNPLFWSFSAQFQCLPSCDPRSVRFGAWWFGPANRDAVTNFFARPMLWGAVQTTPEDFSPHGYGGYNAAKGGTPADVQLNPTNFGTFYFPARLCRNNAPNAYASGSSYVDPDGVRRIGDSGMAPAATGGASFNPYARVADRPIVLNRPFRSVAELGYVLRDDPWRTLDFFSTGSADGGLLDLFTVADASTNRVAAGRISLNGRSAAPLASVLAGAGITDPAGDPSIAASTVTAANAGTIAAALTNFTSATGGALLSRDQAATRFGPSLAAGFASADDQYIKPRREAVARALCDVGQARTWNLMIDLVAQAGRYAPAASSLSQFVVEGERRYWLHVAIDRVTGKVVDSRLEPVAR